MGGGRAEQASQSTQEPNVLRVQTGAERREEEKEKGDGRSLADTRAYGRTVR